MNQGLSSGEEPFFQSRHFKFQLAVAPDFAHLFEDERVKSVGLGVVKWIGENEIFGDATHFRIDKLCDLLFFLSGV